MRVGPGTIWESWDDTTNSHNHPMFTASIGKYLYALAGLQPEAWLDPTIPELRPGNGNAATAQALRSASVTISSRKFRTIRASSETRASFTRSSRSIVMGAQPSCAGWCLRSEAPGLRPRSIGTEAFSCSAAGRGAGPIRLAWRLDAPAAQFHANASVPHGFRMARLTMMSAIPSGLDGEPLKDITAVTFTLHERHSGLQHHVEGPGEVEGASKGAHRGLKATALRRAGVLGLSMRLAREDHSGDDVRHAIAELAILSGEYEFELVATVGDGKQVKP